MKKIGRFTLLPAFIGFICIFSCKKDNFITDSSVKLSFSREYVLFDTVFTTVGSATKAFTVYNKNSRPIKVASIRLGKGTASNFRINVDGYKGTQFSNIEIAGKDSLFVFAEVTVDPNKKNNPLVINDSIIFETNGNTQNIKLEAWGKDAYFHVPNIFPINGVPPYSVLACNAVWKNDKPHVIYGLAVVAGGCSLTMQQGTKVYLHPNGILYISNGGTLSVKGAIDNPVIFQGDRLESDYTEAPGQWSTIYLSPQSKNNTIDWAIIKNGTIGIEADSLGSSPTNPKVKITNTIIKNMSAAAIYGINSSILGANCVFANCGQYVAALTQGGMYNFIHCIFANYWSYGTRQFPTLVLTNFYKDASDNIYSQNLDSANFYNCIIYGNINNEEEIKLNKSADASKAFNYKFHNSLLKTKLNTSSPQFQNVLVNLDPLFNDIANGDYGIKNPLSSVIDKGDNAYGLLYPYDLSGKSRMVNPPSDIGAYEYDPF